MWAVLEVKQQPAVQHSEAGLLLLMRGEHREGVTARCATLTHASPVLSVERK